RPEPVEHLPKRLLRLSPRREAAHLRTLRATTFEPVPVCPQRLPVGTLRLQPEHLTLLDHHEPPRSNNGWRNLAQATSQQERASQVHSGGASGGRASERPRRQTVMTILPRARPALR